MVLTTILAVSQLALFPAAANTPTPADQVYPRGDAGFFGSTGSQTLPADITGMARTPSGNGYWLVTKHGEVRAFGDAAWYGPGYFPLQRPVVDIAPTVSGNGYWLLLDDGYVYGYGDAPSFGSPSGSMPGKAVALRPTSDNGGYWIFTDQGAVYPYGTAVDHGSMASAPLSHPIVGAAVKPDGSGYWLLAGDGHLYFFANGQLSESWITTASVQAAAIAPTPTGDGYWVATADGNLFARGDALALDGVTAPARPIVALVATPTGAGVWLAGEGNGPGPPGAVAGTITDDTGAPAPGVCVTVVVGYPTYQSRYATTDAQGGYRIEGLDPGSYSVYANDCDYQEYLFSYYPGSATVTSDQTTIIDFSVPRAAALGGVVTDPSGAAVEGLCVSVIDRERQNGSGTVTGADGSYRMGALPAGSYIVQFAPCSPGSPNWAKEWWDDSSTEASATPVVLTAGQTRDDLDAVVTPGAAIDGVVSSATALLENVCVTAFTEAGTAFSYAYTSVTGYYRLSGLQEDSYRVRFEECVRWDSELGPEWWSDRNTLATADAVTTSAGQVVDDIDAVLTDGGAITGTVTDGSAGIANACVQATDADGLHTKYAWATSDGTYRLPGLGATSYRVRAADCSFGRYGIEWFQEKGLRSQADLVPVTAGATAVGVDFTLEPAGAIAGTVTEPGGSGLPSVCVLTYDADGENFGEAFTDASGRYRLGGLRSGDYRVKFRDCGNRDLATEWYDDQADFASATPVTVVSGGEAVANAVLGEAEPPPPATVPDAPTGVTAERGNGSADVSWSAPVSNGGSAITGYTVTVSGGTSVSTSATATTVTGLTNGTTYTFTVRATNGVGDSAESAPSNPVTPATVPDAPTGVVAVRGNGSAEVSWTAPASDGGSAITGYTVTAMGDTTVIPRTVTTSGTSTTIDGLVNGTTYTVTVRATNGVGNSAEATPPSTVTPATVPDAPSGVTATAGNKSATVSWTAPPSNGDPITGYTVTISPDGTTMTTSGTSATFGGLSNGKTYSFTVRATNGVGDSATSAPSNPVTPKGGKATRF